MDCYIGKYAIQLEKAMSGIIASRLHAYETIVTNVDKKALEAAKSEDDSMDFYKLLFEALLDIMEPPIDNNGKKCL